MAKCKSCNADIPDGVEYCENCLRSNSKSDESYLDSLLKKVINAQGAGIKEKKNESKSTGKQKSEYSEDKSNTFVKGPEADKEESKEAEGSELEKGIKNKDTENREAEEKKTEEKVAEEERTEEKKTEEKVAEEKGTEEKKTEEKVAEEKGTEEKKTEEKVAEEKRTEEKKIEEKETKEAEKEKLGSEVSETIPAEILDIGAEQSEDEGKEESDLSENIREYEDADSSGDTDDILSMIQNYEEEYLNEKPAGDGENEPMQKDEDNINKGYESEENDLEETVLGDTDEDLLSLLDMISSQSESTKEEAKENGEQSAQKDAKAVPREENISQPLTEEPVNDELLELSGLFNSDPEQTEEEFAQKDSRKDTSQVFADALSAVDSLEDEENRNILDSLPELNGISKQKNKDKTKKKKSFFEFLFGDDSEEEEDSSLESLKKPKEKKKKKKDSEEKKDKKKAEKKPKVKKEKKPKVVKQKPIDPEELKENSKKLNKPAVIMIFAFFATIALVIVIGTNVYSYSLNINNAKLDLARKRYVEAYDSIYGLKINTKDKKTYDRIMTIMYVNKELDSYHNYYTIAQYPQALDSLLKGLLRYNQYIGKAKTLGVQKDLDGIKEQILSELENKFNINEEEAAKLNNKTDQVKYSINVYRVASRVKIK
jgi:AAA ATPase containing von Willebrand factor type A (vWA) domain